MKKTALITGITGQDGSYVAELLLEKGYRVVGMTRRTSTDVHERIQHIFEDIELHEAGMVDEGHRVMAVAPASHADTAGVRAGHRLRSVDGRAVDTQVVTDAGPGQDRYAMEFFNALAELTQKPGQTASCVFESAAGTRLTVDLRVRAIFDGAAFARELLEAGAMTQGLC